MGVTARGELYVLRLQRVYRRWVWTAINSLISTRRHFMASADCWVCRCTITTSVSSAAVCSRSSTSWRRCSYRITSCHGSRPARSTLSSRSRTSTSAETGSSLRRCRARSCAAHANYATSIWTTTSCRWLMRVCWPLITRLYYYY